MAKFESELQLTSIKNASTSNGGIRFSDTSNTLVVHIGDDNRVGIGTDAPLTTLDVDGTIRAKGLLVPPSAIATATDTADFWGFNPKFDEWYTDDNGKLVANGYIQTGDGDVIQSEDAVLGAYSAKFPSGSDVRWSREIEFVEPLYANVFIQGTYSYKFESYTSGEPGLAITLTHRPAACTDATQIYSNTFIAPTFPGHISNSSVWQTAGFRAVTPPNREITKLKIEIISENDQAYNISSSGVELSGASGNSEYLGGGTTYDWHLDGLNFMYMHPDMRIDQEGRITGAYIAFASITDAHIKNYIASQSSRIEDNPNTETTALPEWHINYPTSDSERKGTGLLSDALVANSSYAAGWSIDKEGDIKATGITIYSHTGKILIKGGSQNPFSDWEDRNLSFLDPSAHSYLYGLSFEESNSTGLRANVGFLATSGLSNNVVANVWSMYIANTVTGPAGNKGGLLANSIIKYNGIDYVAPPGSILTGGKNVVKDQSAHILFLANTEKWDTNVGINQKYHANTLLGEFGLYVLGTPTVGGWLYHPHANNTWYTIDSVQSGNQLHENDFLVIGKIATDSSGEILPELTYLHSPKHPDSITAQEAQSAGTPIGIPVGGILFSEIHSNRYQHTANAGEVQLTNQRNTPNTRFAFIHPVLQKTYTANGADGVLTSLEDFPGSRYITFIGGNKNRPMPSGGSGFTLQGGHSPDFVAAFKLGNRWFYNQDEGKFSEFTPVPEDCIVARVDANGSVGEITNTYRYAVRETTTAEGATLSDLIIDPPRGMDYGGIVFADFTLNKEFDAHNSVLVSNSGFLSIHNPTNDVPKNSFFVVHPNVSGYSWQIDGVGRGVVTNINANNTYPNGLRSGGITYGTRHIAFTGHDPTRFTMADDYENVANDFMAVSKYDSEGNPNANSMLWYYDNGANITSTFAVSSNDFVVATLTSFNPETSGIDDIHVWADREIIDSTGTPISSIRDLLNDRIDAANQVASTAIADAQDAFANAVAASTNASKALGILDGEIVLYYNVEDKANDYANNESGSFDYNDIWINISSYNRALDGSWYANSIFRYSNTTSGFDGTLAWKHDPTNPGGLAALGALETREFADRATIIYYQPRSNQIYPFFGPNVAITSTGIENRNPEGDLWFDLYGTNPTNHLYVYRTNTAFSESNTTHLGYISTGEGAWSQTVHNVATSGPWSETAQTGWWSVQDSAAGNAAALIANVEESAAEALAAAETAQAAADREINAFFQPTTAINTNDVLSTGFGDIWIQTDTITKTDGTVNTLAIYRANGAGKTYSNWVSNSTFGGANSAIGLMYAQAYSSGISGEFDRGSNLFPRGYSMWDARLSDYSIAKTSSQNGDIPYPLTVQNDSDGTQDIANTVVNTSFGYVSSSSLQLTGGDRNTNDTEHPIVWFANTYAEASDKDIISRSSPGSTLKFTKGKRWIFSYYVYSNSSIASPTADPQPQVFLHFNDDDDSQSNTVVFTKSAYTLPRNEWTRLSHVLDFSNTHPLANASGYTDTAGSWNATYPKSSRTRSTGSTDLNPWHEGRLANLNSMTLRLDFNQAAEAQSTMWFDGFQWEEVPDNVFLPSQFKEPSDASSIVFGRKITDGKIVTHYGPHYGDSSQWYGPIPNTTPLGFPNPEPHGDFWVNTSNNNIIFRYHQNDLNVIPTSQTVYWTSDTNGDGWYTTEDLRTVNALSTSYDAVAAAAQAQASADREIIAFFQPNVPTATGNGDIWIDTDKYATLNTSAIYVAFSAGAEEIADAPAEGKWYQSPTSAIGKVYLEAYTTGEKVSRSEALLMNVLGTTDLPFPIWNQDIDQTNVSNGIVGVGATGNVVFYKNREANTNHVQAGEIHVTNEGGIDFVGPTGKIWYPASGQFGVHTGNTYIRTIYEDSFTTLDVNEWSGHGGAANVAYLMYSNQNVAVRFGGTNWGNNHHFAPVIWDSVLQTWKVRNNNDSFAEAFIPDAANGDFLVAQIERKYQEAEGIGIHNLDSWIFETLPSQVKGISDGKIITHYLTHYATSGPDKGKFGPKPNLSPSGFINPNPHGDLWVDTSNNNLVFRYHQNTYNNTAQTVFHAPIVPANTMAGGGAGYTSDEPWSGWYSTEDLRIDAANVIGSNALARAITANTIASNALARAVGANTFAKLAQSRADDAYENAATAQAAADREIIAVFQPSSAIGTSAVEATGFGDIWIQTDNPVNFDGTPNTEAIFRSSGAGSTYSNWVSNSTFGGENSAIGMMYLESFASGVSGAGSGSNIIPRGYSLFDAADTDYVISSTTSELGDSLPYPMYLKHTPDVAPRYINVSINTTAGYIGTSSLQLTSNAVTGAVHFSNNDVDERITFNNDRVAIDIPRGKKWVFSYFIQTSNLYSASFNAQIYARDKDSLTANVSFINSEPNYSTANNTWERRWLAFDFSNTTHDVSEYNARTYAIAANWTRAASPGSIISDYGSSVDMALDGSKAYAANLNSIVVRLAVAEREANAEPDPPVTYLVDGLQLEEVPSDVNLPSVFKEPSDSSTIVFGRQITDGKIVTRYEQQYGDDPYYGPEPHFTPKTRLPNPEPHGDSWHNLSNNNIIFRYHQNSTNHTAQSIFYPVYGEYSIAVEDPSGWYSTEDPRAQTSYSTSLDAAADATDALSKAATAQAAADREIQVFFDEHDDPPIASGNGDVWIHIDNVLKSDGSANTEAIYVAFTKEADEITAGEWERNENSAIGLGFLKQLTETSSTNWMPRGYSLFDAPLTDYRIGHAVLNEEIMVQGIKEPYAIKSYNNLGILPSGNIAIDHSGGANSIVGSSSLRITTEPDVSDMEQVLFHAAPNHGTESNQNNIPFGIQIPRGRKWILSNWAKANSTSATTSVVLNFGNSTSQSTGYLSGSEVSFPAADTWQRNYWSFDLSGSGMTSKLGNHVGPRNEVSAVYVEIKVRSLSTQPIDYFFDAFQFEEVSGDRVTPGQFQEPSIKSGFDFSRAIADGKIITHYENNSGNPDYLGPDPSVTPKYGLPNPTPYGDMWVDTANNNLVFRYHQNSTNYTSRSVFHANNVQHKLDTDESGWYSTEDLRTANLEATTNILTANVNQALSDAAFALSASDAEILVFFETSTNTAMINDRFSYGSNVGPATGNGDIWIQIDKVYDEDGNQNTASILIANLHPGIGWQSSPENAIGRGFLDQFTSVGVKNWMPSGYSTWDEPASDYLIDNIQGNGNHPADADTPYQITGPINTSSVVNTSFGYVSPGSLQVTSTDTSPIEGTSLFEGYLHLSNSNAVQIKSRFVSGVPGVIPILRGKRWIFSWYAYSNSSHSTPIGTAAFLRFNDSDDPTSNVVAVNKSASFITNNKWQRNSLVFDFSNTHVDANASGYTSTYGEGIDSIRTDLNTNTDQGAGLDFHEGRLANLNFMQIRLDVDGANGNTVWFDGLQLEEAPGARILPAPFSDPDRQISNHWARSLADGKIVTHYEPGVDGGSIYYGPRPYVTPSGIQNPAPHGDFWVDTANNNALYRYNQNNSYKISTYSDNDAVAQTSFWSTIAYGENQSGWYSIQDGRMDIISANVQTAFGDIANAVARISNVEATSDHELQIFFDDAGGYFGNAIATSPDARFGDLWINTSGYNRLANGSLLSNAIFRWQNSTMGSATTTDTETGGTTLSLAWRHSPNNSIGKVYLRTYAAQNAADSKVTAYFQANETNGNRALSEVNVDDYYGPQTNTSPTGIHNENPDGDIWINTANNNEMYVFNRNSTTGGSDALGYRQKVYWDSSTTNEGWYSSEDLRIGAADSARELAEATGTDRHVQIFITSSAPTTSTGNGDIWISSATVLNTDESANLSSIHIANTKSSGGIPAHSVDNRYWHTEPTSSLGRSHLERLISETGSNWMPRGYSLWDAANTDYHVSNGSYTDNGGKGSGFEDSDESGMLETTVPYPLLHWGNRGGQETANVSVDRSGGANAYIGSSSLKTQTLGVHPDGETSIGGLTLLNLGRYYAQVIATNDTVRKHYDRLDADRIAIPQGRKWVMSWYAKANTTASGSAKTRPIFYTANTTHKNSGFIDGTELPITEENTWKRYSWFFDLSSGQTSQLVTSAGGPQGNFSDRTEVTHLLPWIQFNSKAGTPITYWFDALQLEEVKGNRVTPSPFQEPSPASDIDFSRAIADGKTIYFVSNTFHTDSSTTDHKFGPKPTITPEGLANPEPYGDKWISTYPPYKTYLYFSNATNKVSQTAYHVPDTTPPQGGYYASTNWPYGITNTASGWYEYRDTGDALTQFGVDVTVHGDSLNQTPLNRSVWTEGQLTSILEIQSGIYGDLLDWLEARDNNSGQPQGPLINYGNPREFGPNREILLNPVPPSDANLQGHWTLNSYNVDEAGNKFVFDVSGRKNHAIVHSATPEYFSDANNFVDHDPAEDVINVSGNRSLYLRSTYDSRSSEDGAAGVSNTQNLVLGGDADLTQRTYQGSSYPVNIEESDSKWNQQTLTFWYKPGVVGTASYFVGRDGAGGVSDTGQWNLRLVPTTSASGSDGHTDSSSPYGLQNEWVTANGDIMLRWSYDGNVKDIYHDPEGYFRLGHGIQTGWYGANDAGTYTPLRFNEWHFIAMQTNYEAHKQTLWVYREGEGLLYTETVDLDAGADATSVQRPLMLNGTPAGAADVSSRNNANGYYDEVRLYNSILTPRNIRYLYMNPTGRPRQLQPRPGMAVKKGYVSFTEGNWNAKEGPAADAVGKLANTFAYFHGFDVDGNPADVDPYISFNGQVKYLTRDFMKMYFEADTEKYAGNTGYVMYSDTPWSDSHDNANYPINSKDVHYVFAMPIGANATQVHTWQYHDYNGDPPFIKFTPDDSKHLVVGEVQLANTTQQPSDVKQRLIQSLEVYQFARQPSVVRQGYNFTIRPQDFASNMQAPFAANDTFWNSPDGIDSTFIDTLVANKIATGTLTAGVFVGAEAKVTIDGRNSRIVIKD